MAIVDSIIRRTRHEPTVQWFLTQNFANNFVRYSVVINITRKRITIRISHLNEPTSEFHTHSKSSTTENFLLHRAISY